MANLFSCIDQAVKDKKIKQSTADQLKNAEDPNSAIMSYLENLTRTKREAAIQAVRLDTAIKAIDAHPKSGYDGLVSLMTKDPTAKAKSYNVEYLGKFYQSKYHSHLADALNRFRTKRLGFSQDKEGLRKLTKAIYGETVDDAEIMAFAKEWRELIELIRQDFNAKGGSISKNEYWLLPQLHDMLSVRSATKDDPNVWKEFIRPLLDREKMTDARGKPITDSDFDELLDYAYEAIATGGMNKVQDTLKLPKLNSKLARRGSEKRVLYFKDADSWLAYNEKFGRGDIFTALTDYIDNQANDIAMMEMFGPKPEDTYRVLKEYTAQKHKLSQRQSAMSDAIFDVVSGKINGGELTTLADGMTAVRNVLTAARLGGATLSAISDEAFSAMTARWNNIPAHKVLSRKLKLAANEGDRVFAVRLGLGAESWISHALAGNRYGDIYGVGPSAKLAEGVMRGSGLSGYTSAGRKAFGMEFSAMLFDNFHKPLDELDRELRRAFEAYNISAKDWDAFRNSTPLDFDGAKYADLTQDGSRKFHQMVLSETDYAVPTPDARTRAITAGGLQRGTVGGQIARSMMMFRSFPIAVSNTHLARVAYQSTTGDKIHYAANLTLSTAIMGGIALQAKDVAKGREPRPLDTEFLFDAFMQGGATGIIGDLTLSDLTRYNSQATQAVLGGPVIDLIDDTYDLTVGNLREAVAGEETNVLGEGVRYLKSITPNPWQTAIFTNALYDQLEIMADPDAQRKYRNIMYKRQKDYDSGYWWGRGQTLPEFTK